MGMPAGNLWKISEVERLVGLPRRDIQRACYEGKGGVGILKPSDSRWGKRNYDEQDLAILFLLAEGKRRGQTLSQAARHLKLEQQSATTEQLLRDDIEQLEDQLADVADRLARASALAAACENEPQRTACLKKLSDEFSEFGQAFDELCDNAPNTTEPSAMELLHELMGEKTES